MKNLLVNKEMILEALGEKAKIKISKEVQNSIDKNWENLYSLDDFNRFASVEVGEYMAVLENRLDVIAFSFGRIKNSNDNITAEYEKIDDLIIEPNFDSLDELEAEIVEYTIGLYQKHVK